MLVGHQPTLIWKSPASHYSLMWISVGPTSPTYLGPDPWNLTESETFQGAGITPMLSLYGELWASVQATDIHHQNSVDVLWLGNIPLGG